MVLLHNYDELHHSVPSNLVEGFRRNTVKDSLRFYNTADASLEEVKYFLLLSKDLRYISIATYTELLSNAEEVGKLLTGWIKSQSNYL
jgi:four helix bundle protein